MWFDKLGRICSVVLAFFWKQTNRDKQTKYIEEYGINTIILGMMGVYIKGRGGESQMWSNETAPSLTLMHGPLVFNGKGWVKAYECKVKQDINEEGGV